MNKKTGKQVSTSQKEVENFNLRLKELIGDQSISSFGQLIDASEGGIRKWLNKTSKPSFDKVVRIADECKVNLEWLATGKGEKYNNNKSLEYCDEYAYIPVYNVTVSTGHGIYSKDESITRHLAFRKRWLQFRNLTPSDLAVVYASGDSMEPTIHSNNSLLVATNQTSLKDGCIYVLRINDDLFAKRLQKGLDGSVILISDNKEYEKQRIEKDKIELLNIIGKVVWIGKDLN
ncbi:helix-turn-helix transcriptional regulator [uncultured Shewanella sp.]|uniref:LexA family transcriptional regulator n=1 Tax=uncultured Shewanella sp. TaxID=173975 RepID=UPI0026070BED|nr:helix-turn-helix transcriptional regulator [uncultured Shewanella sp.]